MTRSLIKSYNKFQKPRKVRLDWPRQLSYRPDGLRYSKTVGGGSAAATHIHLWDGQNIVAEVGATGALNTRYIRGTGLIAREADSALQYYLFDAHGDVLHRLDASGNMLKTYRYDAFGNEIDPEPLDTNPFRYCGEYFDREIGTYYLRARNYDPRTGRFTTEDTLRSATVSLPGDRKAVDPLSLNLYTYCHNNPVQYTDPTGNAAYNGVSYPVSGRKSSTSPSYWPIMNDSSAYKSYLRSQQSGLTGRKWWNEKFGGILGFKVSHKSEVGKINNPLRLVSLDSYVRTTYSEDDLDSLIMFENTINDNNPYNSTKGMTLNLGSFKASANFSAISLGVSAGLTHNDGTSTTVSIGMNESVHLFGSVAYSAPSGENVVKSTINELSISPIVPLLAFAFVGALGALGALVAA